MTIKDLVSTHQRVIDRRENIDVIISIYEDYTDCDESPLQLPPDVAIDVFGDRKIKAWFETNESTCKGVMIDISILCENERG